MKLNLISIIFFFLLTGCKEKAINNNNHTDTNELVKQEVPIKKSTNHKVIKSEKSNPIVKKEIAKAIMKNHNIFAVFSNSTLKQLTFNDSDYFPYLLKNENKVLFIRNIKDNSGYQDYTKKAIMKVDIDNLKETIITNKKPYLDGNDRSDEILTIGNPTISKDLQFIYFIVEKYATSNQLVKVNLKNGKWTELFSAETFELLTKPPYKNNFIIGGSEIRDKGRDIYYKLVDISGKTIKEFDSKESVDKFKNEINK